MGIDNEISGTNVVVVNFSHPIAAGLTTASFDFKMGLMVLGLLGAGFAGRKRRH